MSPKPADRSREIALLPSLLTTGNLLCGYGAIVFAAQGQFVAAAALVFLGLAFDIFDGQVARWMGIATDFGIEYDSLADVVTFGLAPSFLLVRFALEPLARWGWVSGFLFVVGAALRLARFNVRTNDNGKTHFQGLPTPAAAGTVTSLVLFLADTPITGAGRLALAVLMPTLAVLMVSDLPYRHFKQRPRPLRRLSWFIAGFAALLALAVAAPRWVLPVLFGGYTLLGPLTALMQRVRPRA